MKKSGRETNICYICLSPTLFRAIFSVQHEQGSALTVLKNFLV